MAIEKNTFKVARFDPEYPSMHSSDTLMSSDDEDFQRRNSISAVESDGDDDDEFDDCDSGAGSDDFDLLELGETSEEFCQVGNKTCSIPYELYDLPGLKDVLSMEVWNEFLTERERFGLARYLPDMDQEDFTCTLKELFAGDNLHFGSPVDKLFEMLKGGLCEPRVALYRQGLNFFQRRQHYHNLKKHQNTIVNNLCQIRDAWLNCRGYSIEEKLRVLNIIKSQKSLMNENMEELGGESSDREESLDDLWGIKVKVPKLGQKMGRYFGYHMGPTSDISSGSRKTTTEPTKSGKQNLRGSLNLAGLQTSPKKKLAYPFRPTDQRIEMKSGRYGFRIPLSGYGNAGDKSSAVVNMSEQMMADEEEAATIYEVALHREQNFPQVVANSKPGASKIWKKHQGSRADKDVDSFKGIPISARNDLQSLGWNKAINQLSDIKVLTAKPSNARDKYDGGKRVKYAENLQQFTAENQMKLGKTQNSNLTFKGSRVELLDGSDSAWLSKQHGGLFPSNLPSKPSDLNAKNKRWKLGKEAIELQENDKLLHAEYTAKSLKDNFQASSLQNGRRDGVGNQGMRTFSKSEETESGSSEQMNVEDEDDNTLMRSKWAYPGNVQDLKYGPHTKKAKLSLGDKKDSHLTIDGSSQSSRKIEGFSEDLEMMKEEQMGKMNDIGYLNILPSIGLKKNYFPGPDYIIGNDDRQQFYQLGRNGNVEGNHGDSFHIPSMKSSLTEERRLKDEVRCEFDVPQSNYMHDYKFQDDWFWMRQVAADNGIPFKLDKSGQMVELPNPERYDIPLMGCNNLPKKWKMKHDLTCVDLQDNNDDLHAGAQLQLDDISFLRKRGKNKLEDVSDSLEKGMSETPIMEIEMEDVEAEPQPQKKPFPLITPTVLSGFSFSIIHLLSAVRMAMITLLPEDSSAARKHIDKKDAGQGVEEEQDSKQEDTSVVNSSSTMDINTCGPCAQAVVPSLTVQEIVNRVRSNPGDPCIIETQEPLQDLVRGVLKIFSSRSAPLGAKRWKPLVVYEKSSKSWSWIGPVSHNLSDSEAVEEVTSPDSWGLPHKMLVKLVDSYANWLKNSQDALQQIGSLPSPPLTLMQINFDEKERFKDMRAQKSLSTISLSSEEVKAYFHKEEVLRYLIPDRAFSYTAVDGKKSIVAPLRRCGGKPTSKARDHFMLKRHRPPHVTILCLVRDAAARLPGSIGTRADVCTLIRDSQYIVEDVSDAQVNQVVSGALDRLHYERDPCVQFDGERKLWVYLHREREEEDFEDDGTSSTKKWRRPRKEATEPSDQVEVTVAYMGPLGQSEFDLVSDLNVDKSCVDNDKRSEPDHHNANGLVDDNAETSHGSDQGVHHGPVWNGLGLNTMKENKLICRENSNSEDFIGETFDEEPPI